jgi:hypothetical protein
MVLHAQVCGRVGRCRGLFVRQSPLHNDGAGFFNGVTAQIIPRHTDATSHRALFPEAEGHHPRRPLPFRSRPLWPVLGESLKHFRADECRKDFGHLGYQRQNSPVRQTSSTTQAWKTAENLLFFSGNMVKRCSVPRVHSTVAWRFSCTPTPEPQHRARVIFRARILSAM